MTRPERSAFTLVELLVVVVIIAMLMALLLPAINRSRQEARRAECLNNEKQIFTGIANYEQAKGHLPGYINKFGSTRALSWAVVLFPYLGHNDHWENWRAAGADLDALYPSALVGIPELVCPSGTTSRDAAPLSYVVNCGLSDAILDGSVPKDNASYGLFHNRMDYATTSTTDRIRDGAANTILLSENVQARTWAPPLDPNPPTDPSGHPLWNWELPGSVSDDWREAYVGMVWWPSGAEVDCAHINQCLQDQNDPIHIKYARPSSFHAAGVNVTYADGHQAYINTVDVDYKVLRQQMIHNDAEARKDGLIP